MFVLKHYSPRSIQHAFFSIRQHPKTHSGRLTLAHARSMTLPSYLLSPKQLNSVLHHKPEDGSRVVPLCASWFLPNDSQGRTGIAAYKAQRIPGARFFDLDIVKDNASPYPHMLPSRAEFAKAMGELGIGNNDTVVVYDTKELGIFSAPRVGWTLKVLGHEKVHLLNNFRLWVDEGYPTESGEAQEFQPKRYAARETNGLRNVVDFQFVKRFATGQDKEALLHASLLDARPKGRWAGTDPEPRPGLPSGHIPNSISVPFTEVLDPQTRAFLPASQLKKLFADKGVNPKGPVISSCGTGVTAVVLDAALTEAGYMDNSSTQLVYDGSWTEWAQRAPPNEELILKTND